MSHIVLQPNYLLFVTYRLNILHKLLVSTLFKNWRLHLSTFVYILLN